MYKFLGLVLLLITAPALSKTLTIYTYSSFASDWGPGPAIKKTFEAQCHCQLQLVALDDGVAILNRLRLEGKRSKADIILGLDNSLLSTAKDTGLLAQHQVELPKLNLPNGWHDDTFLPYDYGYFAFIYNAEQLSQPPHSFAELLERPELTLLYQDPRTSTVGQGLMLWVQTLYGERAARVWQNLAKRTVAVTKGWSESYGMFLKGEADLVLSYTSSPAYHLEIEQQTQYQAANFSEGHYLQVEVAAMLKASKEPALARQFLTFMLSPDFQQHVAQGNWMFPVIDTELPDSFTTLITPTPSLSLDSEKIRLHRSHWLKEWRNSVLQ
ncbi:thiamine ABC transporter substrate binding subunit [Oceanisphaera avium]|uniref:Thiamine-binding periplasmic protein n=1 Tax=Oceanisphaera avium TaxID=1903694 RepID=A0A1Y0CY44_9GAMM|nr:thiamine ABC transporter substrate binding subunit [Oceanisphaera avium]ART80219.1 thiamine ABC transporter substrate binding subunit [Oceanisphaera avium]